MASDIIWTNHLQARLAQRGISKNQAFETIRHPTSYDQLSSDKYKFYKNYPNKQITLVAVRQQGQWVILTAWSKPLSQAQKRPGSSYTHQSQEPLISRVLRKALVKFVKQVQNFFSS